MVKWLYTKEIPNEKGPHILIEWSRADKRNKSVRTINSGEMVVHIVLAKMSEREWSILSSSPTISAWNKCMELVVAGWCTRKLLRFDQIIRNLTSGDCGISLLLIRLGVTGLRKTRVVYFLDLFEGRAEK